jgi:hypothetical protein
LAWGSPHELWHFSCFAGHFCVREEKRPAIDSKSVIYIRRKEDKRACLSPCYFAGLSPAILLAINNSS